MTLFCMVCSSFHLIRALKEHFNIGGGSSFHQTSVMGDSGDSFQTVLLLSSILSCHFRNHRLLLFLLLVLYVIIKTPSNHWNDCHQALFNKEWKGSIKHFLQVFWALYIWIWKSGLSFSSLPLNIWFYHFYKSASMHLLTTIYT